MFTWRSFAVAAIVVLTALALRVLTIDRYLPVADYPDEPVYVALAQEVRGMSDQTGMREMYGTLAPLYVTMSVGVQAFTDATNNSPWEIPAEFILAMRWVSIFFGVVTALLVAWTGYQLAGTGAALLAGLVWAAAPLVVEMNNLAIPDPPLYAACALAVASGAAAIRRSSSVRRSVGMLFVSLLAGIAALYLKLWTVMAILPFITAGLILLRRDARRFTRPIALLLAVGAAFAIHFVGVVNPLQTTWLVRTTAESSQFLPNLLNPLRWLNNLWHLLHPIDGGSGLALWLIAGGGAAYLYARRAGGRTIDGGALLLVGVYTIFSLILSAGISEVALHSGMMRHILPTTVAALPLWAAAVIQIAWAVAAAIKEFRPAKWLPAVATAAFVVIMTPGAIAGHAEMVQRFARTHPREALSTWFDTSPPRDGLVMFPQGSGYAIAWERAWGAYTGSKPFDRWEEPLATMVDSTPADFLARGIRWLVVSEWDITLAADPDGVRAFLEELFPVKRIDTLPEYGLGDRVSIFRMEPPQTPAGALFGGWLRLTGYDLSTTEPAPGETIQFRPYWRLEGAPAANLSMFLHLYPAAALTDAPVVLAQWDGEPVPAGGRPTLLWTDTDEVYFGDLASLTLPADLPPGDYTLAVGVYDYATGVRLADAHGATYAEIPLEVK